VTGFRRVLFRSDKDAYENVVQASEADFGSLAEEVMGNLNERRNDVP
jgi:hypothetical protein